MLLEGSGVVMVNYLLLIGAGKTPNWIQLLLPGGTRVKKETWKGQREDSR
jgi:hypothetical protein